MNKPTVWKLLLLLSLILGVQSLAFAQPAEAGKKFATECDKNNHAYALTELTALITREPNNDAAFAGRAYCYATKGENANASADAEKALRVNSKNVLALGVRGFLKRINKDYVGALDDFDRALSVEPNNHFIVSNRSNTFAGHDDPRNLPGVSEKLAAYKKEAEASNQNFEAYARLDEFFRMIQPKANASMKFEDKLKFDDQARNVALAYYDSLTKANNKNVCAHYFYAKGYRYSWRKQAYDSAINNFDGVNGARCSAAAAFSVATSGYSEYNSDRDVVIKYLNLALQRDPNHKDARGWIARVERERPAKTTQSPSSNNTYSSADAERAIFQKELMEYEYNLKKLLKERAALGMESSAARDTNKKKLLEVIWRGEQMYRNFLKTSPAANVKTAIENALNDALKLKSQIEAEN